MVTARRWLFVAVVGSLLALSTRPDVSRAAPSASRTGPTTRYTDAMLTPQGFDHYLFEPDADRVVVRAATTNTGGNLRQVWWASGDAPLTDAESCVTWTANDGDVAQAGVALRVRQEGGRTVALTVTNNVWAGARAGWNVHAWDGDFASSRLIGQALLTEAFGESVFQQPPLPWRICARTVGSTLEFRAWSLSERLNTEWGDPRYGASILLPPDVARSGRAGWYVGHLRRGDQTTFTRMEARPVSLGGFERIAATERAVGGCMAHTALIAATSTSWVTASGCGTAAALSRHP